MNHFKHVGIIVPVDMTDAAIPAVDLALDIAADRKQITCVHVAPSVSALEPGVVYAASDESRHENLLKIFSNRFAAEKYHGIAFVVLFGDPGHEIAEFAQGSGSGLIVMPSHSHGQGRLLMGSVTERVVRLAQCSVMILRN